MIPGSLVIGNLRIDPPLILSPLDGISTPAMRTIFEEYGAGLTYTEMVSSAALFRGVEAAQRLMTRSFTDGAIFAVQIFGHDPYEMEYAAFRALEAGAQIVDINMGCPMKDIVRSGAGAALMKTPSLAAEIVQAVVQGVGGRIPVTVKIRAGWDDSSRNAPQFAPLMVQAGAVAVTVHGRTRAQVYSGRSSPEIIREVVRSVSVPVIANGDITSVESFARLLEYTGAAAGMIGRASFGNPWLFRDIAHWYRGVDVPPPPDAAERLRVLRRHVSMSFDTQDPHRALIECKRQVAWYTKGLPGSGVFRNSVFKTSSREELLHLVDEFEVGLKRHMEYRHA